MSHDLKWVPDLQAESRMKSLGVEWGVSDLRLHDIDFEESLHNFGRLGEPLVEATIVDYVSAMLNGDAFPMISVRPMGRRHVIIEGNHRAAAARRIVDDSHEIPVYVLHAEPHTLEVITRSGNNRHGLKSSKQDDIRQAVYCVQNLGMSVEDMARVFNVSEYTIRSHIQANEARAILGKAGVDTSGLGVSHMKAIAKIPDESTIVKVGTIASRHNMTAEQLDLHASKIAGERNHAGRLKAVKHRERELSAAEKTQASSNGKGLRKPRRDKIIHSLTSLSDWLDKGNNGNGFTSMDELQCTSEQDVERFKVLAKRVVYRLDLIRKS